MNELRMVGRTFLSAFGRSPKFRVAWAAVFRCPCLVIALSLFYLAGCFDRFGTGGTGERVVPREQLREIRQTNLEEISLPAPATRKAATLPADPTSRPAADRIELSIEQARQWAIANNLDLKVELLNPTIARESLSAEEARFESIFFANLDYSKTDAPTASKLNSSQAESISGSAGIQIPLRTGGTVRLSLPLSRFETNNEFSTLNPAYTADYLAQISQPILRGAGFGVSAAPIRIAFYNYQRAEARTKLRVISILTNIDYAYWELYRLRRALEVTKADYDLAITQLERAQRQVRAGAAGEPEIVRAEAGVASTLVALINADTGVRDQERVIKTMVQHPGLNVDGQTIIIPITQPGVRFYRLDAAHLQRIALEQRMEMLQLELQLLQEAVNIGVARNDLLPLLNLDYSYNISGLGPSLNEALGMAGNHNFDNHRVGLRLEVPIGNEAAKARLRRALAQRMQALATRDQQAAIIREDVLLALEKLYGSWAGILAARKNVTAAQRVVDVETRQFGQGLRTSTDVLNAQTELLRAQLAEIQQVVNYQRAQVELAFATGTVLGASKVIWEPTIIKK